MNEPVLSRRRIPHTKTVHATGTHATVQNRGLGGAARARMKILVERGGILEGFCFLQIRMGVALFSRIPATWTVNLNGDAPSICGS